MSHEIDEATVRRVAKLARVKLDDAEVAAMKEQLASVLAHVAELATVDVEGVEPSFHARSEARWRPDVVVPGLDREVALAAAPEPCDEGFAVPRVIE